MASILKPAYAFYNRHYQARPILTICVTNAFLAGISDTLTQKYLTPSTTPAPTTSEKVSHKVNETVENVTANVQEGATELAHKIDQTVHKDTSVDSTASATLENIKEKGGQVVYQGQELVHQGKQQVENQLSQSDLVHNKQRQTIPPTQDFARTGRFMFYNFSVAPIIHTWYTVLDKNFPIAAQAVSNKQNQQAAAKIMQTLKPAVKRVTADQILFAPIGLAMLFTGLTVLEGGGLQQIKDKLNNTFIPTLQANYLVWPMVQLVNFSVMPLQLRLPFVSVVGIAWNAYLSLVNTRGQRKDKQNLVEHSKAATQAITT
ncbi:hypothetical protein K457DRAFT_134150 [Linnemannia elongata AG-77]|uniref:Integral membrane protein, Mpv17/PMP22 family n=1 Tax=Linnemannia elongata AG-77 TaxID=1314771 RepID=A0A197K9G2_9FUNG|nr:hypothetical protein K457DRAFT_134150 [Linnemannia elongata AG-77]